MGITLSFLLSDVERRKLRLAARDKELNMGRLPKLRWPMCSRALVFCCFSVCYLSHQVVRADTEVILSSNGITVTEDELVFYVKERLRPEVYESAMSKPDAIANAVTNIYVIKRASQEALSQNLISADEVRAAAALGGDRAGLKSYSDIKKRELVEATDWEALARERYILESEKFETSTSVDVDHILIKPDGRSFDELVQQVRRVQEALESNSNFSEVAIEYSDDKSVEMNSGSLGFFRRGTMDPRFEDQAFSMLVPGEISPPVLTSFGVHIIRFNGRKESEKIPFEQVKDRLITQIKRERLDGISGEILRDFRFEPADEVSSLDQTAVAERVLVRLLDARATVFPD